MIAGKALRNLFSVTSQTQLSVRRVHVSPILALGKEDMVKIVAQKTGLTQIDAKSAVEGVLDTIVNSVAKGEKVTLVGFGVFERTTRAARKGRNPRTGEEIDIAEKMSPTFKAGKTFKETVAGQ